MHDPLYDRLEADKAMHPWATASGEQIIEDIRADMNPDEQILAIVDPTQPPVAMTRREFEEMKRKDAEILARMKAGMDAPQVKRMPMNRAERRAAERRARKQGKK